MCGDVRSGTVSARGSSGGHFASRKLVHPESAIPIRAFLCAHFGNAIRDLSLLVSPARCRSCLSGPGASVGKKGAARRVVWFQVGCNCRFRRREERRRRLSQHCCMCASTFISYETGGYKVPPRSLPPARVSRPRKKRAGGTIGGPRSLRARSRRARARSSRRSKLQSEMDGVRRAAQGAEVGKEGA